MDNREIGEVTFTANDQIYTLRYTSSAWVALEAYLDRGMMDILEELMVYAPPRDAKGNPVSEDNAATLKRIKRWRLGFVRALFWAGFHDRHKDVTIEDAGDMMDQVGGMVGVYNLVMAGVAAAQPAAKEGAGKSPPSRPRVRANGRQATGSPS